MIFSNKKSLNVRKIWLLNFFFYWKGGFNKGKIQEKLYFNVNSDVTKLKIVPIPSQPGRDIKFRLPTLEKACCR